MNRFVKLSDGSLQPDRRSSNGSSKLIWAIMMSSCGLVAAGAILWFTNLTGRMTIAEATLSVRGERLSSLEAATINIDKRLTRIEDKLDKAISIVGTRR